MPLNPMLHQLLNQHFGAVKIQNENEAMAFRYLSDPLNGGLRLEIDSHGESYYVNCPFCSDTRQRLSINHRYGVHDAATQSDNLVLTKCFNDDCLKEPGRIRALSSQVFRLMNVDARRRLLSLRPGTRPASEPGALKESSPPGDLVDPRDLPADHPAVSYIQERGFDLDEVCETWNLLYCIQASRDHAITQDRLIIPIVMNGVWIGWQARYVGQHTKGERMPKYISTPGLPKRLVLYNHDLAVKQPATVICEGPTDVWRVGPAGIALLGKEASQQQLQLLAKSFADKPIIVLLDGDAETAGRALASSLKPLNRAGVVQVTLPADCDPGACQRAELWSLIHKQCAAQGVSLPSELAQV